MLSAVFSAKGGVGVSAVAAFFALAGVESAEAVTMVDLCGDLPVYLGIDAAGPGLSEWAGRDIATWQSLQRVKVQARADLSLIPRGHSALPVTGTATIEALAQATEEVVIDCGRLGETGFRSEVAAACSNRLLVVRCCYVTLRRSQHVSVEPTGVIVVREPGRSLGVADVEASLDAPVVAEIAVDGRLGTTLDAGLMHAPLPRRLLRMFARVGR